jgi:uncharacterized membrane protein YdjX (TVP38/TMEM64 family)
MPPASTTSRRRLWLRLGLLLAAAAAVAVFFLLGLDRYLSLAYLKQTRAEFHALYEQHALLLMGGFFGVYVLVTALSLPGAAVMTLAGGALFGFWRGLVLVSFASTLGAVLAFLFARFLLRSWVQSRFADRLKRINQGVEREGAFYLFTLRLIPVFPFWLINLAMALTPLRTLTFAWVSQTGMLPGTAVYVNAGKQLGEISSPGDVLSWELLLSFALLGVFPLLVKKVVALYRKKTGRPQTPA